MAHDSKLAATREYYDRGRELDRLDEPRGQLEFERTKEIILRHLPPAPAVVADIGGGPGRYALWLADLGYRVLHRDLMPLHVSQVRAAAGDDCRIQSAVADARELDLASQCADAVLLLGPLYHLDRRGDRLRALAEARRVARVEGPAFLLDDLGERLADDEGRRVVLETARAVERVPELLGTGPHLIATGH
jgi:SAM-dependent methyltransferase